MENSIYTPPTKEGFRTKSKVALKKKRCAFWPLLGNKVFRIWQAGARDSGNKIAASAHGMGAGGLAVDAMAIGCLGVERRVERFFSY